MSERFNQVTPPLHQIQQIYRKQEERSFTFGSVVVTAGRLLFCA